ncbi:L,D-transpeptidase family protein [Sodalis-like endosymbiont of Proechinophthirus fluctus]|uniref:L,D-transpeptidase family protein n=1 Tax=Sodalis-like endosymbiont of Proechinophthirus fluctus TaxID=1462730 RepID=UPI00093DA69C|nr:L,D-transpeptidase family protein [Sodalis-like endosymbiont of Proechinophthirus fluctus]
MKMKIRAFCSMVLAMAVYSQSVFAVIYPLPEGKSRLVGENLQITVPEGNKLPLEYFAAQFQMGLSNMLEANPGVDVYLPAPGTKMIIPQQLILPDTPHEGIVINSAEMRLYYYPKDTKTVIVLPIGIGELGKDTPSNWVTSVQHKKDGPTWTPTKAMRAEYAARGETLPEVFPAGPDNPMGLYALYVGNLYAVHGTNANFGIGLRVSHGCVRLRTDDIKYLFDHVPVGTRVQFINEPVKATIEPDGSRYLEVHNPLSSTEEQFNSNEPVPINLPVNVSHVLVDPGIYQVTVDQMLQRRSGMPENITAQGDNGQNATVQVHPVDERTITDGPDIDQKQHGAAVLVDNITPAQSDTGAAL